MRNGHCFRRARWVRHTCDSDCSWWPTPMASWGRSGWPIRANPTGGTGRRMRAAVVDRVRGLIRSTGCWRPTAEAVEWLMGFPTGWSWLGSVPSGTPLSRRSQKTSEK